MSVPAVSTSSLTYTNNFTSMRTATELTETYLGRSWQRWSRHIGNGWRPGIDDLRSYLAYITTCLRSATQ